MSQGQRAREEDGRWLRRKKRNNRGRVRPGELLPQLS